MSASDPVKAATKTNRKRKSRGKKPWADFPLEFWPKHRIFLSIDAIGSTRLKSSLAEKKCTPDVWATSFLAFLPEVVVVYRNKFDELSKPCRDTCAQPCTHHAVSVWKYIGDEVVLVADLACEKHHATLYVLALAATLKHFNTALGQTPILDDPQNILRFKGTAWVAGFPVANIELNLPSSVDGEMVKDFLGQSIDLGFRLSKFSSEDRLVISASLAHLIASAPALKQPIDAWGENSNYLPLCFGGLVEAKGVKGGKHPLIWYSVNETDESKLCNVERGKLLAFLREEEPLKDLNVLPFIFHDQYTDPQYEEDYKEAVSKQRKIPNSIFYGTKRQKTPSNIPADNGLTDSAPKSDLAAESIVARLPRD